MITMDNKNAIIDISGTSRDLMIELTVLFNRLMGINVMSKEEIFTCLNAAMMMPSSIAEYLSDDILYD